MHGPTIDPPNAGWDADRVERRLLALHNRRRIVNHVRANPGIHLRQIARDLDLAIGTAEHHLHTLASYGILETQPARHQTAYFVRDGSSPEHRRLLAVLRNPPQRRLLGALLDDPDLEAPALARRLGMPATSLGYHLQRLIRAGHLEVLRVGRSRLFRVPEPGLVAAALRAFEEGPLADYPWNRPDAADVEPVVPDASDASDVSDAPSAAPVALGLVAALPRA